MLALPGCPVGKLCTHCCDGMEPGLQQLWVQTVGNGPARMWKKLPLHHFLLGVGLTVESQSIEVAGWHEEFALAVQLQCDAVKPSGICQDEQCISGNANA